MMGFSPSVVVTPDISSAYNLLNVISDPSAYKSKLDDLAKQTAEYLSAMSSVQEMQKLVDQDRQEAQNLKTQTVSLKAEVDEADLQNKTLQAELNTKQKDLDTRESNFLTSSSLKAKELSDRESTISNREAAVSKREAVIEAKQQEANQNNVKALELKAQYEDKLNKLKQLV